jgi:hypothetical protein
MSFDAVSRRETSPLPALEEEMATVTQAPGLSTPSMLGNPDGGAPAAATDQSAPCATDGEALVGEGWLPKGKMVAEDQIPPSISDGAPADLPPGGDKLAENGGDTDTLLLGARRPWIERMVGPTILSFCMTNIWAPHFVFIFYFYILLTVPHHRHIGQGPSQTGHVGAISAKTTIETAKGPALYRF